MDRLSQASQFGCFLIFELWDRGENGTETESNNHGSNGKSISVDYADGNGNSDSHRVNGVYGQHFEANGHTENSEDDDNDNRNNSCDSDTIMGTGPGTLDLNSNSKEGILKQKYPGFGTEEFSAMKKSRNILKDGFLSETNSNDNRFLRIFANFSPFAEGEYSVLHPSAALVNEGNIHLLTELNIHEIKRKHNILYESLTSRGHFSPSQNGV